MKFISEMHVHSETGFRIEIFSYALDLLEIWADVFVEADKIVGAQFYYSNPFIYLLGKDFDPDTSGHLYGNLYLINVANLNEINEAQFDNRITAANSVFLDKIGKYADVASDVSNNFVKYHEEYGLYLIGIDTGVYPSDEKETSALEQHKVA